MTTHNQDPEYAKGDVRNNSYAVIRKLYCNPGHESPGDEVLAIFTSYQHAQAWRYANVDFGSSRVERTEKVLLKDALGEFRMKEKS